MNADDPHGRLLLDAAEIPTVAFSLADVSDLHLSASASRFTWRGQVITVPIGGRHNVPQRPGAPRPQQSRWESRSPRSWRASATLDRCQGGSSRSTRGSRSASSSTTRTLPTASSACSRRLARSPRGIAWCSSSAPAATAIGRSARRMGAAAAAGADVAVVTSDNPRSEEPAAIIAEIVEGRSVVAARGRARPAERDRARARERRSG